MWLILWLVGVVVACYLLAIVCDRYFVPSLDEIAKKRKLSDDVAGATLMAVWSSAPEFFTALIALFSGAKVWLGAWTIIWSAIFNILVIIWWSALFLHSRLNKTILLRDGFFYAVSIALVFWWFQDGQITFFESLIFIAVYVWYIAYLAQQRSTKPSWIHEEIASIEESVELFEERVERRFPLLGWVDNAIAYSFPTISKASNPFVMIFFLSLVWIIVLSWLLVESGVMIAEFLGVSEVIIGLTILAAGTSVPDLMSSIIVAKQGRWDMAVTNALWSNIFDICICLWLPRLVYSMIHGVVPVKTDDLTLSISLLFGILLIVLMTFIFSRFRINKYVGWFFLSVYGLYLLWAIGRSLGIV